MLNFLDFEVWPKWWCCTIINPITGEETIVENDKTALEAHYRNHKGEIYVGFNNRQYDDYIFKSIYCGFEPWKMNEWIILKGRKGFEFSSLLRRVPLNTFDCMVGFNGLKTLEAFLGMDIRETTIPFDYDGEFTPEMKKEALFYNRHDVMATIKVFMERKSEFDSYMGLVKLFGLPLSYLGKSKAQLAAIITGARKTVHNDEFDISIPPTLRIEKYTQVVDYFKNDWNYDNNFEIEVAGVPHVYGTGGIHGAIPNYFGEGEFLHVDVNSYYPSLVIRYPEYCMTRTGASLEKFTDIYNQRLEYKAQGNPMADALKIVINSFYGAMKDRMNPLYDPRCANNICIFGQLLLTDLIERLEGHCDLIQSNTDGLIIKLHGNEEEVRAICKDWEERTGMSLGYDRVFKIAQKDVNNYIMTMEKKGKIKVEAKGAYVKDLSNLDYDLAIVNEAVRAFLLDGVPVERTINDCYDLRKFQKVVKLSNKYKWVEHEQGFSTVQGCVCNKGFNLQYNDHCWGGHFEAKRGYNGGHNCDGCKHYKKTNLPSYTTAVKYENKAYRVFASIDINDGRLLKCDGVRNPAKFANTPDKCFIFNDDLTDISIPSKLDYQWYINLAYSRLQDFGVKV